MSIPLYIINLEKDKIKKNHMINICKKYGLKPIIISAIDGKSLTDNELKEITLKQESIKTIGRELTNSEIGCALSHKLIYEKIIAENIENALILEDDVKFELSLNHMISKITNLPNNCDLMLLGHHSYISREKKTPYNLWFKKKIDTNLIVRRPIELVCGAYGYYLTNRGAKKLLKKINKFILPLDHYTGNYKYINLYLLQTPIIKMHKELTTMSNIEYERNKANKNLLLQKRSIINEKFKIFLTIIKSLCMKIIILKKYK